MNEMVEIIIEYHGEHMKHIGMGAETLLVSQELKDAVAKVRKHLKENHGIDDQYLLFFGSMHIQEAIKEKRSVEEGRVFKVIPYYPER